MSEDVRSGRISVIAHCLLNQNSRAKGLAERPSMINEVIKMFQRNKIGIIQMPCPEVTYAGALRQPQTREKYDNVKFREVCKKISKEIAKKIQEYEEVGVTTKFILGVGGSPSCSVSETRGILIEELQKELEKRKITIPFYEINCKKPEKDIIEIGKIKS